MPPVYQLITQGGRRRINFMADGREKVCQRARGRDFLPDTVMKPKRVLASLPVGRKEPLKLYTDPVFHRR
jgi:hypothetical protein